MKIGEPCSQEITDIYCCGFRYFKNYEETKENYLRGVGTLEQGWYGANVLIFDNLSELNAIILQLTLLRDSINSQNSKHHCIKEEFGTNEINIPGGRRAATYPPKI